MNFKSIFIFESYLFILAFFIINMPKKRRKGTKSEIMFLKQKEEYESKKAKRAFYIILDIITLSAFVLALYYTYFEEYTKVILFLVTGTVILMYFIVRAVLRKKRR